MSNKTKKNEFFNILFRKNESFNAFNRISFDISHRFIVHNEATNAIFKFMKYISKTGIFA